MNTAAGEIAPPAASPGRGALPPTLKIEDFQRSPQDIFEQKKMGRA